MQGFLRSWLCMSGWKHAIEKMDRSTCAVCSSILQYKILVLDTGNVEYNLRMRSSESYPCTLPIIDQLTEKYKVCRVSSCLCILVL